MDSKLKVYFYSPGFSINRPVDVFLDRGDVVFTNPTPLYLSAYIQRTEPELLQKFEWAQIQYLPLTQQQLIDDLNQLNIDVLALSTYTWNDVNIKQCLVGLKSALGRPIKIIIGGPSVNVVRSDKWLLDLPDVDFAIYAQGEIPFVSILKHYLGIEPISVLKTKNVAWVDNGRVKKADYEFIRITKGSPVVQCKDLLERIVNDPRLKGWILHFPYETSRGCPYNCTFCDWTSGLSHKVSKRKFLYEEELDVLGSLGIVNLYMADANFGIFPEDVEIAKTMARLKKEKGYQFFIHGNNLSKTKKDIVFQIADIFAESGIVPYMKFSVQDIDETVLKNIERPDISWEKHIVYINNIMKKYPHVNVALDIIKGLPGQTRDTFESIFKRICPYNIQLDVYDWEMIANSPAGYDQEYRERMQLQTLVRKNLEGGIQEDIVSTYSYDLKDYAYFTLLYQIYSIYFRNYVPAYPLFIPMIKSHPELDNYLEKIVNTISDKNEVRHLAMDFMVEIIKLNIKKLNRQFVKEMLNYNMTTPDDGINIIKSFKKSTRDIGLSVFASLPDNFDKLMDPENVYDRTNRISDAENQGSA